jgi:hypothetical protein
LRRHVAGPEAGHHLESQNQNQNQRDANDPGKQANGRAEAHAFSFEADASENPTSGRRFYTRNTGGA